MAEFPALPLFTDAYLADTIHLTTEEHGAYLLLLMCAWRTRSCSLRDDDKLLARIAGVSSRKWARMRPCLEEFFTTDSGHWRQKKLTKVNETVAKKVARNRANGALGGRAKARGYPRADMQANSLESRDLGRANGTFTSGWQLAELETKARPKPQPDAEATKTKTKTKKSSSKKAADKSEHASVVGDQTQEAGQSSYLSHSSEATREATQCPDRELGQRTRDDAGQARGQGPERDSSYEPCQKAPQVAVHNAQTHSTLQIATAADLCPQNMDCTAMEHWFAAGATLELDIIPTIERLLLREKKRTGRAPEHLGYYSAAILEQHAKRMGRQSAGAQYDTQQPEKRDLVSFDPSQAEHWRLFLGDADSRFRGEYVSKNWAISQGHPVFTPAALGPDPCHRANPKIPKEIYSEYAKGWAWRPKE